MTGLYTMPPLLMAVVAVLLILGSTLTLLGAFGLVQLKTFYDRIHAPTLGSSWGAASILLASLLSWSWVQDRVFLHEVVIGVSIKVTTPVPLMLLGRAVLYRDRTMGPAEPVDEVDPAADLPVEEPEIAPVTADQPPNLRPKAKTEPAQTSE